MATFVRTQEVEHEIGQAGTFVLEVTSGEVELRAVDGHTAHVRARFELRAASDADADELFERVRLHARPADGLLELTEPRNSLGAGTLARILRFGSDVGELRIEADLPRGAEVRIAVVSAELTATGFSGQQQYRTVSGDLVLTDAGGEVRVKAVSGDISIRAERLIGLDIGSVSGDLSAVAPRFSQVRANTVSGDIEIEGALDAAAEHRVETVSGDLSLGLVGGLALEVRGLSTDVDCRLPHRSEGSRDRRRYIIGDGRSAMAFSSMSGDVSIQAARRVRSGEAPPEVPAAPGPKTPPAPAAPEQLEILRALERGELSVDEAARRLSGER